MLKESKCETLKEKMRIVANTFLTHRQIGEAEAVYRLIPHLTLTMSNLRCQFVSLGPKEERSVRWTQATDEDLKAGLEAVQISNREGYWFESIRYMLNEVMLYRPLHAEVSLDDVEALFMEEYNGRRKVDIVKNQVMEHLVGVEEARHHVAQVLNEMTDERREEIAAKLDAMGLQDDEDCLEEGLDEHDEYE